VGRTIYAGDELIGTMDTPELAARVVEAVNRSAAPPDPRPETLSEEDEFCPTCGTHVDDQEARLYPWKAPDGTTSCCAAHWIKKNWPRLSAAPPPTETP